MKSLFAPPPPKSAMRAPVVTVKKVAEMNKQTKKKIGLGSVLKSKVGELEKTTRERRIRSMRIEVMGCVQSVTGKKKLLIQFKDGQ